MKEETREKILDEFERLGTLRPKAGLTYALEFCAKIARIGFGISRREMTRPRKELSPFIHAFSTFNRYMGIAKEFVLFCQKKGVTRLHKLTYKTVEDFLMEKIMARGILRSTVRTNVCALQKFFHVSAATISGISCRATTPGSSTLLEGGAPSTPSTTRRSLSGRSPNGTSFRRSSPSWSI